MIFRTLSDYPRFRGKAIREDKPGFNTLVAILSTALVKHDRQLIDTAMELTKDNVPTDIYLPIVGSALYNLGLQEEGVDTLRKAARSNSSNALLFLAAWTNDLDEKENAAKKVLSENPQNYEALRHLAYAKYFKGEREEAERLIDEILSSEPDNFLAVEYKGNIYFDRKQYDKALEQYLKIRLKPTPISLQFKICHCYYLLGMIGKAKRIAKKIRNRLNLACDIEMKVEDANKLLDEILSS